MKNVKVLGPGCMRCNVTADLVKAEAEKAGVAIELEKVTDIAEIMRHGVMTTPGVVVDGKLVHAGGPKAEDIAKWLKA
ncbi:MAG: thioredoxin family protein [Alphaproteobacteria bacterium]